MLYYYDTPLTKQYIRRQINKIKRNKNRRFQKEENKSLLIFCIGTTLFFILFYLTLLNSPTMVK